MQFIKKLVQFNKELLIIESDTVGTILDDHWCPKIEFEWDSHNFNQNMGHLSYFIRKT